MVVRIEKDNIQKTVTKGAYEEFYKDLGFKIIKKDEKKNDSVKEAKIVSENFKKFNLDDKKEKAEKSE